MSENMKIKFGEKDPRLMVLDKRVSKVGRILPVMSSKGGVGKTLVSVGLSLALKDLGYQVGLLDLDITNPSAHVALGVSIEKFPEEEKGVRPPLVNGVEFMSVAYYSGDSPLPLRGPDIDNAIKEILAITIWGNLDFLIIDSPPGLSDEVLDILSFFKNSEPIIVATPSPLAVNSVRKLLELLKDYSSANPLGLIENMAAQPSKTIESLAAKYSVQYLGNIRKDPRIDYNIGDPEKIRESTFFKDLSEIAWKIVQNSF